MTKNEALGANSFIRQPLELFGNADVYFSVPKDKKPRNLYEQRFRGRKWHDEPPLANEICERKEMVTDPVVIAQIEQIYWEQMSGHGWRHALDTAYVLHEYSEGAIKERAAVFVGFAGGIVLNEWCRLAVALADDTLADDDFFRMKHLFYCRSMAVAMQRFIPDEATKKLRLIQELVLEYAAQSPGSVEHYLDSYFEIPELLSPEVLDETEKELMKLRVKESNRVNIEEKGFDNYGFTHASSGFELLERLGLLEIDDVSQFVVTAVERTIRHPDFLDEYSVLTVAENALSKWGKKIDPELKNRLESRLHSSRVEAQKARVESLRDGTDGQQLVTSLLKTLTELCEQLDTHDPKILQNYFTEIVEAIGRREELPFYEHDNISFMSERFIGIMRKLWDKDIISKEEVTVCNTLVADVLMRKFDHWDYEAGFGLDSYLYVFCDQSIRIEPYFDMKSIRAYYAEKLSELRDAQAAFEELLQDADLDEDLRQDFQYSLEEDGRKILLCENWIRAVDSENVNKWWKDYREAEWEEFRNRNK